MNSELFEHKITDRQSFVEFLKLLRKDFLENPGEWENKTIDTFLDAMSEYVEGIQAYYDNTKQNVNADIASWKVFSDIFQGARIYE